MEITEEKVIAENTLNRKLYLLSVFKNLDADKKIKYDMYKLIGNINNKFTNKI